MKRASKARDAEWTSDAIGAGRRQASRRTFLRLSTLGALGAACPSLRSAQSAEARAARATSVLVIFAQGGISHHDSFDPKPDAPSEIRGEFSTIATTLPGVRFSELVPRMAGCADRYALMRSFWHRETDHGVGSYFVLRGQTQPDPTFDRPENQWRAHPNIGSHVARLLGPGRHMPPYVVVPGLSYLATVNYYTAGWLGRSYDPFLLKSDPNRASGQGAGIPPLFEIDAHVLENRFALLDALHGARDRFEASRAADAMSIQRRQAYELLFSGAAREAFDLERESPGTRDEYGRTRLGQSCLLARRLVEAGVPFVTVDDDGWDHHADVFPALRRSLPQLDQAFSTLLVDLERRGLLATTLVLLLTEFGRTPMINKAAGRDHWPRVFSSIAAGAGIRGGQVIGASDRLGGEPVERPLTPKDLAATIYAYLGLDAHSLYASNEGRPLRMLDDGQRIRELWG